MKIHLAFLSLALVTSGFSREEDLSKPSTKLKRFIEDVVYVVEAGNKESYSKRWVVAPHLVVNSSDIVLKGFVEKSYADICKDAQLGAPGEQSLTVYIGDSKELNTLASQHEKKISLQSGHCYWIRWNEDRSIKDAVVFLCVDRVSGMAAQDVLIEDLLGSFGFAAKSREFDQTCLSMKPSLMGTLSPLDRKMISFYYTHIPPGTRKVDFRKRFDENWSK